MTTATQSDPVGGRLSACPPLFIIGSPRSGTTMLLRLMRDLFGVWMARDNGVFLRFSRLQEHFGDLQDDRNVRRLFEAIFADPTFQQRFARFPLDAGLYIQGAAERTYTGLVRHFLSECAKREGCRRWGNKTPSYALAPGQLTALFPDARVIHLVRDGRDVALSLFKMPWGPKNAYCAAHFWREHALGGRCASGWNGGEHYLEMRYEDLLAEPEAVLTQLAGFCQLDGLNDAIARVRSDDSEVLYRDNCNKWKTKLTASQLKAFESVAGDTLSQFGYERSLPTECARPASIPARVYYCCDNLVRRIAAGENFSYGLSHRLEKAGLLLRSAARRLAAALGTARHT